MNFIIWLLLMVGIKASSIFQVVDTRHDECMCVRVYIILFIVVQLNEVNWVASVVVALDFYVRENRETAEWVVWHIRYDWHGWRFRYLSALYLIMWLPFTCINLPTTSTITTRMLIIHVMLYENWLQTNNNSHKLVMRINAIWSIMRVYGTDWNFYHSIPHIQRWYSTKRTHSHSQRRLQNGIMPHILVICKYDTIVWSAKVFGSLNSIL